MRDDIELLRAWGDGDKAAGSELVQRHMRTLYAFFASKVASEVDDLIQRTWLACVKSRASFRGDGSFRSFVFGIARHELYSHYRKRNRQPDGADVGMTSVVDLGPSPSRVLSRKREHELLLRALQRIPLDYQIAIELFYWESMSGPDLARALEIPESAVRTRLTRARKALSDAMKELAQTAAVLESTMGDLAGWANSLRDYLREAEGIEV